MEVPGASAAGVLLADRNGELRGGASSEQARLLELRQLQSAEGPYLERFHTGTAVTVPNLATEERGTRKGSQELHGALFTRAMGILDRPVACFKPRSNCPVRGDGDGLGPVLERPGGRERASTAIVEYPDARVAAITARGLEPERRELYPEGMRKVTCLDPDCNEIAFGGARPPEITG